MAGAEGKPNIIILIPGSLWGKPIIISHHLSNKSYQRSLDSDHGRTEPFE
jgi:hypothetical protein